MVNFSFNEAAGIPRGRLIPPAKSRSFCVGFNEAAGIPRGRPESRGRAGRAGGGRFNEAAGIPRGRQGNPRLDRSNPRSFNEAAGIPRGRPAETASARAAAEVASMRPRVFPAEDGGMGIRGSSGNRPASMRPRVFPAEDNKRPDSPISEPLLQ